MAGWVSETLDEEGVRAPAGFVYLGHSLRSGGSSAAEAIRVPRFRGNWLGSRVPRLRAGVRGANLSDRPEAF